MNKSKWRDTLININDIEFKNIKITKVIGYPYAGNDVFYCMGKYNNKKINFYIKIERDNNGIDEECTILSIINNLIKETPRVLEFGKVNNKSFIVTQKILGNKLSELINNDINESLKYMHNYGAKLAYIHSLKLNCKNSKQRKINDIPKELENDSFFDNVISWLKENAPAINNDTFVHGDFHYANILWKNYKITGILDWEYSGMGFKEQDIAWAIILRPCQTFMKTKKEINMFFKGYRSIGEYNNAYLNWCLVNGYAHYYRMEKNKKSEYAKRLKILINIIIKNN